MMVRDKKRQRIVESVGVSKVPDASEQRACVCACVLDGKRIGCGIEREEKRLIRRKTANRKKGEKRAEYRTEGEEGRRE